MAWENRKGVGRYYTRSERVGGRVVRRYIGPGPAAELAAGEDEYRRRRREARRAAQRADQEAWDAVEQEASAAYETLGTLIRAGLLVRGFHQHKRGEWRRRRGK